MDTEGRSKGNDGLRNFHFVAPHGIHTNIREWEPNFTMKVYGVRIKINEQAKNLELSH